MQTPIIFRATPQWFIGMETQGLRQQAVGEIKQVRWIPDWGQARIENGPPRLVYFANVLELCR